MSDERRVLARNAARNMASKVADAVPEGLGRWGPAWSLVEAPSIEFMDALERFELTDPENEAEDHDLRREVHRAASRLLAAWKDAAVAWEAAGRPTEPWTPDTPAPSTVEARR